MSPLTQVFGVYRRAYSGLPRQVWLLSLVALVNRSGTMVLPFLTLFLTTDRGFTAKLAGLLMAAFGVGSILGTMLGGWLADRVGPARVQAASLVLTGLGFLFIKDLESAWPLGLALFAIGVVGDAFRPANLALLSSICPPKERTRGIALNRLAINAGVSLGPAIGGILAEVSYDWLFLIDGSTCLIASAIAWGLFRKHRVVRVVNGETQEQPETSPLRDPILRWSLLLTLVVAFVVMQLMCTVPLYYKEAYDLSERYIGFLFGMNPVLIVAFEMVLVDRLKNENTLKWVGIGSLFLGISYIMLPFGSTFLFAAVAMILLTIGEMLESPLMGGFISSRAGPTQQGRAIALYTTCFSVAMVTAPILGTLFYERVGPRELMLTCGFMCLAVTAAYFKLAKRI